MFLILLFVFVFCIIVFLWYLNYLLGYWDRKKNIVSIASDIWTQIRREFYYPVSLTEQYKLIYDKFADQKYGGCFNRYKPVLMIREPDIIQHILNKDFEYFRDRGHVIFDKNEPLTNHLFSAPATLWRDLRIRLTPTFTSGKIKYMFDLIKECAEEYQQALLKSAMTGEPFDIKDQSVGYTIEVISSTAFGLKTNSVNSDSEFKFISRQISKYRLLSTIWLLVHNWFPSMVPYLPFTLLRKHISDFFFKTIRETVAYRKQTQTSRNDFLQILISLNEKSKKSSVNNNGMGEICKDNKELEFTNELMTAQCFLFFVAGFDTSSLVLSGTLLELAMNHDIQAKLHKEIDQCMDENDNKITYEMIKSMSYLHKIVQESMRKYSVLPFISRVATKNYQIPGSNLIVDKGTEVIISIEGLHYDPKYFPNPEKFDPERFTDDEIQARHKFVYLPFGAGPRNCIGSRFALVSVKLGIVHLLHKYQFDTTPDTIYPIKYKPHKLVNDCDHKLLLKCSLRNH